MIFTANYTSLTYNFFIENLLIPPVIVETPAYL